MERDYSYDYLRAFSAIMIVMCHVCLGAYSMKHYMPVWLALICVFAIAIVGGWLLNKLTSYVLITFPKK